MLYAQSGKDSMKIKIAQIVLFALFLSTSLSVQARDFPGIQSLMTNQELMDSGVDKLSAEEIKVLNQWLLKYTKDDVPVLVKEVPELTASEALRKSVTPPVELVGPIQSRVQGDFRGWSGKTIFKLENGQTWKQRNTSRYYRKMVNPEVIISKNLLGFYVLELVETGRRVGVKQIK